VALIYRPHHSTVYVQLYMQPIVTDQVAWSVCLSVTVMSPTKMAEPIEMLFGLWTQVGPRNHVLDGDPDRRM